MYHFSIEDIMQWTVKVYKGVVKTAEFQFVPLVIEHGDPAF